MKLSQEEIDEFVELYNNKEFSLFSKKMLDKSIFDELDDERKLSYPEVIGDTLANFCDMGIQFNEENITDLIEMVTSRLNNEPE